MEWNDWKEHLGYKDGMDPKPDEVNGTARYAA